MVRILTDGNCITHTTASKNTPSPQFPGLLLDLSQHEASRLISCVALCNGLLLESGQELLTPDDSAGKKAREAHGAADREIAIERERITARIISGANSRNAVAFIYHFTTVCASLAFKSFYDGLVLLCQWVHQAHSKCPVA